MASQVLENKARVFFQTLIDSLYSYFRMPWRFVGIIDSSNVLNLTTTSFFINSLCVASFAFFQRRIHEYFDKAISTNHVPHVVTRGAIRTDRSANDDSTVSYDLGSNKAEAANVQIAVSLTKAKPLRKMSAHDVCIEERDLTTMLLKQNC